MSLFLPNFTKNSVCVSIIADAYRVFIILPAETEQQAHGKAIVFLFGKAYLFGQIVCDKQF